MCGKDFCAECTDAAVTAWAVGHSHKMPVFGDEAQRRVARDHRQLVFNRMLMGGDFRLALWPEYLNYFQPQGHMKRLAIGLQALATDQLPAALAPLMSARNAAVKSWGEQNEWRAETAYLVFFGFDKHYEIFNTDESFADHLHVVPFSRLPQEAQELVRPHQELVWQWTEDHLAEVEVLLLGRTVYADHEQVCDRLAA
ncbi:MAG: hypothetical protein JWO84_85 [Parcubacteria group bacterium]|nr:hypothetical protein [Parcubacteria group bacterium]